MEKQLKELIELYRLLKLQLKNDSENLEYNKDLVKQINNINDKIKESDNFLLKYLEIISNSPDTLGAVWIILREYDLELSKRIYETWYNMDKEENWTWKYMLSNWDEYVQQKSNVDKYKQYIEENKSDYQEILNKFDKLLKKYES